MRMWRNQKRCVDAERPRMKCNSRCVFDCKSFRRVHRVNEVGHGSLATISENEFVFQFHRIVEEVVPVIVVRRIERNELVVVGQELLSILLISTQRQLKVVRLEHDIVDVAYDTRNIKVRLTKNVPAVEVSLGAVVHTAWVREQMISAMGAICHRRAKPTSTLVISCERSTPSAASASEWNVPFNFKQISSILLNLSFNMYDQRQI